MSDPLKEFQFKESEGGLFLKLSKGDSVKLRVLTTDPLVTMDKWGNTRFNFVVWNWDLGKAQILSKGASIARPIRDLHIDEDYGADIQKIDVKITANSTGPEDKDVEYSVNPLPKPQELTKEILAEAKEIDLEKAVTNGKRMSELNAGEELPSVDINDEDGVDDRRDDSAKDEVVLDDLDDEPVDLSDIPF